ncbi:hypothetical protein HDV00_009433 [Rhizophlyctis rosea]|nr:hypothetical protein HDV00_009433 [Rhizophlyctis rosea]
MIPAPSDPSAYVDGVVVYAQTFEEISWLDQFESEDYTRTTVTVYLTPSNPSDPPQPLEVDTYIWTAPLSDLTDREWSYEEFVRDRLDAWMGHGVDFEDLEDVEVKENQGTEEEKEVAGAVAKAWTEAAV